MSAETTKRAAQLKPGDEIHLHGKWRRVEEVGEPVVGLTYRIDAGTSSPRASTRVGLDEELRTRRPAE